MTTKAESKLRRTSPRASRRGYTVVEVMSAMTLFAIGAAGVISMQKVTIQGGDDARRFDIATNIAREWQHRLQRDSMFWTKPNSIETQVMNLNETRWLSDVGGGWKTPVNSDPPSGISGAFDILGRDVLDNDPDMMFCAQYRLTWIADPGLGPGFKTTAVMRAEVRVFWARLDQKPANCRTPSPTPDDPTAKNIYHFVYVTTALRGNPPQ